MNRPYKPTAASSVSGPLPPYGLRGVSEAAEAKLPNLSKPWGRQPICPGCNRGATYSCICDPFFEDEDTPEPRFDPDNGWGLAERAAYGMGVAK